jgi:enoyl-CoA hydratase
MVLRVESRGPVRLLTIDRPEVRNAISRELVAALVEALGDAERDERVATVVLASSSNDVFVSGGDLNELTLVKLDASGAAQVAAMGVGLATIERLSIPVIAAVEGRVLGGGAEILLMCDACVMARSASVSFLHARMGLTPAWGGATRLIERVGAGRAADLLFTTRALAADEALAMGLSARVVDDGGALDGALDLALAMAVQPRAALAHIKRSLQSVRQARRAGALEAEGKVFRSAWGSEPHRAAFEAAARKLLK